MAWKSDNLCDLDFQAESPQKQCLTIIMIIFYIIMTIILLYFYSLSFS